MPRKSSNCPHVTTVGDNSWEEVEKIKTEKATCETCRAVGPNLWLCLHSRCLYVGCGESSQDHSSAHTETCRHYLTLNMTTMRIWCYACESEVFKDGNNPPLIMIDKPAALVVPATPKKVATPTSAASSPITATATQEESESEEDDDNLKPRGLTGLQNIGNTCYMNAAIQSLSNCPPLSRFFLDCPGFIRTDKKPMLSKSYQKLMLEMWHRKRPSYVVPSSVAHGIKLVHPMFRGYTQQDSQEFLRCFMDQIHEELKQAEVLPPNSDTDDADSANHSMTDSQQALSSGKIDRSHDIPFHNDSLQSAELTTSGPVGSVPQSDTDYETCDSGMSSERSSMENGTIGAGIVEEETGGNNIIRTSNYNNKDLHPKPGHARKHKATDKNKVNPEDKTETSSTSNVILESSNTKKKKVPTATLR